MPASSVIIACLAPYINSFFNGIGTSFSSVVGTLANDLGPCCHVIPSLAACRNVLVFPLPVTATVEFRNVASATFQQSGVNFQYIFTLRDIASVLHGLCYARPTAFDKPVQIIQLWLQVLSYSPATCCADVHCVPVCRSPYACTAIGCLQRRTLVEFRNCAWTTARSVLTLKPLSSLELALGVYLRVDCRARVCCPWRISSSRFRYCSSLLFAPFSLGHVGPGSLSSIDGSWHHVPNPADLRTTMYDCLKVRAGLYPTSVACTLISVCSLQQYNESEAVMNLVLFDSCLDHILRVCRVLCRPSAHMLLVGVGGSGKQSLVRLAAFVCGMAVRSPGVSASYSLPDFRELLKGEHKPPHRSGG